MSANADCPRSTLVSKDLSEGYTSFMAENGIKHIIIHMKGTKKEDIPIRTMKSILRTVLDQQNHPLLIHCNHGKVGGLINA
jgi:tyrosine-protein phosphatase SIW14